MLKSASFGWRVLSARPDREVEDAHGRARVAVLEGRAELAGGGAVHDDAQRQARFVGAEGPAQQHGAGSDGLALLAGLHVDEPDPVIGDAGPGGNGLHEHQPGAVVREGRGRGEPQRRGHGSSLTGAAIDDLDRLIRRHEERGAVGPELAGRIVEDVALRRIEVHALGPDGQPQEVPGAREVRGRVADLEVRAHHAVRVHDREARDLVVRVEQRAIELAGERRSDVARNGGLSR